MPQSDWISEAKAEMMMAVVKIVELMVITLAGTVICKHCVMAMAMAAFRELFQSRSF
jgi:hypothetical protein